MSEATEKAIEAAAAREAKSDALAEANILRRAMLGEVSWTSKAVIRPVAMAAGAGALGVVTARYFTKQYFPPTDEETGEADTSHMSKRGAAKIVVGLAGAGMMKKVSPSAALGFAVGLCVDGVCDLIEDSVDDYLDDWFGDEEETTAAPAAERPAAGAYFRRVG